MGPALIGAAAVLLGAFLVHGPAWSPDGRRVARVKRDLEVLALMSPGPARDRLKAHSDAAVDEVLDWRRSRESDRLSRLLFQVRLALTLIAYVAAGAGLAVIVALVIDPDVANPRLPVVLGFVVIAVAAAQFLLTHWHRRVFLRQREEFGRDGADRTRA